MQTLTIKARILVLGVLAVGGIILAGGFGIFQLSRFNSHMGTNLAEVRIGIETMIEIESASIDFKTQVQEWKNILIRGNKADQYLKYHKAFSEKEAAVQARLKKALDILKKENDPANAVAIVDLEKLLKAHTELGAAYKAALGEFNQADPETGKKVDVAVKGKDRNTAEGLDKLVANIEKGELDYLARQAIDAQSTFSTSRNWLIAFMVIAFILSGGVILVTLQVIARQIAQVKDTTEGVKATLDLTRRIPLSGQDEMSQVAGSVNALLDEFQIVVKRMKGAGDHVSQASGELSHSVVQLSSAVQQQNEATSSMAASVEEMAVSVSHVSDSSSTAQRIAQESLARAEQGGQVIDKTVSEMVTMAETVQSASRDMEELGRRTDEIGNIAGVIKEIADQTNLLALNAAIEAARAGEQGRGFAVVADEVRKLAERTSIATTEIAGVISAIQSQTKSAVGDMHKVAAQVTANAEGAREAGVSITHIREGSGRVVEVSSDIATALKEQSSASDLIAKHVEMIASMSDKNANAMSEAKAAAEEMKRLAAEMHGVVDRFRV